MPSSPARPPATPRMPASLPLFAPTGQHAALPHGGSPLGCHIGIDEAGRGCLAGPVVAAAVVFPPDFPLATALAGLHDSKQLSEKKRDALAPLIREHALAYGIGFAWQREIDKVNILNATFRAMSRACFALHGRFSRQRAAPPLLDQQEEGCTALTSPLDSLLGNTPTFPADVLANLPLFIDGNHTIPPAVWQACTSLALPQQRAIIDGDALVPAISAASILAKTVRDALMVQLHPRYQSYDFALHKGYGTKTHLDALAALGPCRLHRLTFRKVRPEASQEQQGNLLVP